MSQSNIPRKSNVTRIGRARRQMSALAAGDDASAVAQAVAASPWGTGDFASLL